MLLAPALGGENLCYVRQPCLSGGIDDNRLPEEENKFINILGEVQRSYRT